MVLSPHRVGSRLRLRVGAKFFLAVGVLVLAVLTIAGVGAVGLARMAQRTTLFYDHSFAVSQHAADVVAATFAIHETALYQVAVHDPKLRAQLNAELDQLLIPRAQETISVLRGDFAGQPGQQRSVDRIEAGLRSYQQLRSTSVGTVSAQPGTDAASTALARRVDGILEPIVDTGAALRAAEATVAARTKRQFDATYRSTRQLLALSVVVVLLLGLAIVVVLTRDMVPRIRRYSRFAADVAAGRATTALHPRGRDELAELGSALDDMVRQRELAGRAEHAQRAAAALAEQAQAEYVDTLQVTRTEDEAQDLLQRHLERSQPESTVVVLRRNNSANRLQAATALPPTSELAARLVGAEPRACVAVRLGRTHREGTGRAPLLGCAVCGGNPDRPSTCDPLLVGGEVIGSVLVTHPAGFVDTDIAQIKTTVGQAAPVLANLRSLALAEFRANNDSLTGLPNKRATEDTLKRMVAQASRSITPLAAVMLDLDHFKAINDRYGHAHGDEVLAAVGTAIGSSLRASDFAGRFGGEEFLILLPETTLDAAYQVAEKIRNTVASISIPGVDRDITASLGIAGLLDHANNATGLLRAADRAQYGAKAAGRNRTIIAENTTTTTESAETSAEP